MKILKEIEENMVEPGLNAGRLSFSRVARTCPSGQNIFFQPFPAEFMLDKIVTHF